MDASNIEHPADKMIRDSRAHACRSRHRLVVFRRALVRLYTGMATLFGAGLGYVGAQRVFSPGIRRFLAAIGLGLAAAVVWTPVSRRFES